MIPMQGLLFSDFVTENEAEWQTHEFSAGNRYPQNEREKLEEYYSNITETSEKFSRKSVSYQLSKTDCLHRWLKYKEGFSSELVRLLLNDFDLKKEDIVLDPFMGSGTTALTSIICGFNSAGFDILPMSRISIKAKMAIYEYDIEELESMAQEVSYICVPESYKKTVPEIPITKDGYPKETSKEIAFFKEHFSCSDYSQNAKTLLELCTLNSLEKVSYSAKDGQYLRWDWHCPKIIEATRERERLGKKPFVVKLDKGKLPSLKEILLSELNYVIEDIKYLQRSNPEGFKTRCDFIQESALFGLPKMKDNSVAAVISSPPYCNRYDYTRTYALELAYLGVSEEGIKKLRQELLSCTVENKPKTDRLQKFYCEIGRESDFHETLRIIRGNAVLNEIDSALKGRNKDGEINNKGVLKMVTGYFEELAFIFFELYRICKSGAYVAFVNDNVRYAGEIIPVDYLTTNLAEKIGFTPIKIYTLKQQKGNSSQQMKRYGRVALRKSITVWRK